MISEQSNWVANTANVSSLLWNLFQALGAAVNWAGFYVIDPDTEGQLILGPFHGQVACQIIKIGKGVCGTAAESLETQVVEDVNKFPGHIACDGDTKSEIVVPIFDKSTKKLYGVIDIDSTKYGAFDDADKDGLEKLALLLVKYNKW